MDTKEAAKNCRKILVKVYDNSVTSEGKIRLIVIRTEKDGSSSVLEYITVPKSYTSAYKIVDKMLKEYNGEHAILEERKNMVYATIRFYTRKKEVLDWLESLALICIMSNS